MKKLLNSVFIGFLLLTSPLLARDINLAENPVTSRDIDPLQTYWGDIDQFLDRQSQAALDVVQKLLKQFPPSVDEPLERQAAMMLLDTVLHDEKAPHRQAVQEFFHDRMDLLVKELEKSAVTSGADVWKLYDHGFIVRTPSVTLLFDFTRAYSSRDDSFAIPDETASRILKQCDALFITHRHGDHADSWVAEEFLKMGKPVIAPENIFPESDFYKNITHLERSTIKNHSLSLSEKSSLKVTVFPGHQGQELFNNVYLVTTPEGFTVCHTGDQSNEEDFSWIDNIGAKHQVDVLFPNCWTTDMTRAAEGIAPKLLITGHENELGHSIDHREPNWLTYDRLQEVRTPYILMTWGEKYHFPAD
jgi:L-ascorbate metabolism protein UlaG (beta-lactamase superfamily)